MTPLFKPLRDFLVSLRLTVYLLAFGIVLIFWATLGQVDLGVWGVQHKFFHSFFVIEKIPGTELFIPVFPGGYLIGGLLLINLIAAQVYRFSFTWKKAGIWLTHLGLIALLVGELLSGLLQEEYSMTIDEGGTKNYSVSERFCELAVVDASDPKTDRVFAFPEELLKKTDSIQVPGLPFLVVPRAYYANSNLTLRKDAPNAPPSVATAGDGREIVATPLPISYKEDDQNFPSAFVELIAPQGSMGTFLVSTQYQTPQVIEYPLGHPWKLTLRFTRKYHPFSLTLLKFTHDVYPGTDIPKNFASKVQLKSNDGTENREFLIYMNNPLRYGGFTFYQQKFANEDKTTILQVVKNPGWLMPYVACTLMTVGLSFHFLIHLAGFIARRRASKPASA